MAFLARRLSLGICVMMAGSSGDAIAIASAEKSLGAGAALVPRPQDLQRPKRILRGGLLGAPRRRWEPQILLGILLRIPWI